MKNSYIALWLLLAVALSAIVALSFYEDDIVVAGKKIKKAPIAETLLYNDLKNSSDSLSVESILDEVPQFVAPPKVDSLPQSIFIFGDSMTFNLALRLAQYAKQNGHTIHAVNWDSSSTLTWGSCDTLAHYIKQYHPTQIFISLGSNELYLKNLDARIPDIKHILAQIDTIPYVWIGPPNWKEDAGINDAIEKLCRPGSFFRSAGMTFERKADHVHPTRKSSALWVDSIMKWLPKSAHPFIADFPSDSIGKANPNIIFLKAKNK